MKTNKRKSKADKNSSSSSLNWHEFDNQLHGRVRVEESTRVKWIAAAAQERTVLSLLRKKLKIDERFDFVPITPDQSLSDTDLFAIGETLIDCPCARHASTSGTINPSRTTLVSGWKNQRLSRSDQKRMLHSRTEMQHQQQQLQHMRPLYYFARRIVASHSCHTLR